MGELCEAEALRVADEIVALGVRLVVLTGGEPLLSPWWCAVAARLHRGGVRLRLFTGGARLDDAALDQAQGAGISEVALSLDGPAELHDRLRPWTRGGSSHRAVVEAAARVRSRGLPLRVVTTVSAATAGHLAAVYEAVCGLGASRWQVQLVRMDGRALEHAVLLAPDPQILEEIVAVLLRAAIEKRLIAPMHCSVGYLTEEEAVLRRPSSEARPVWDGADAGLRTFAISPTGRLRACACLPDAFEEGSLRERSLAELWADPATFGWARAWDRPVLAGACVECALAERCRAGCPSVAFTATGTIGSTPFCLRQVRGL